MIMRRLAQNLRDQNWTAITIEFVLLVLGVFLGIEVANWNEERGRAQRSAEFTEQLRADLRIEGWRYQFLLEYYRDARTAAAATEADLSGNARLSNEQLLVNAYRATQYKQGAPRRSTYDELVSTGTINLIQDREFRQQAIRAYSLPTLDNLIREGMQSRYREQFRMIVPTQVQRALGQRCGDKYILWGDYTDFDKVLDYPCTTGLPPELIDASAAALRADPQLLPLLRLRIADLDTRLYDLTGNNRDTYEFLLATAREKR